MIYETGTVREARDSQLVTIQETMRPVLSVRTEDDEKRQLSNVRMVDDENRR